MQRRFYPLAGFILAAVMLFLVQCSPATTDTPGSPVAAAPTPDTAVYWDAVHEAQAAYEAGEFERALTLAREAAAINPGDNSAWSLFQEAAVAVAADDYLRTLPDRRYRKDTLHFLADLANGEQYFIIDVREPDEFEAGHIENAVNIPLRQLTQQLSLLPDSKTRPILIYCHSQKRATHGLVVLRELGYTNVFNLEGGYAAYQEWTAVNPMPTPGPTATPEPEPPSC